MTPDELEKRGIDYALEDDLRSLAGEGPHPLRDAHLESALLRAYHEGQLVTVGGFEASILAAEARGMERAAEIARTTTALPGQYNIKDQWRAEIGEEIAEAIRAAAKELKP